ncbi:carbonic anhydrase, partial [bacterium]|nr:carbonic anhydrase [bacterium]
YRAIIRLREGNARFEAGDVRAKPINEEFRRQLAEAQKPFACVITCSDSRVAPEIVFDQNLGDLFVVRVAGTVSSDEVTGSVEFAVQQLGVPLVVVMAHANCGAVAAALSGQPISGALAEIIDRLRPFVAPAKEGGHEGRRLEAEVSRRNTRHVIESLMTDSSAIAHAVTKNRVGLHRAYYDPASGHVEWDF